jgi:hypothetical protein
MALTSVTLTDQRDQIVLKWPESGQYSVVSAYECQFLGATAFFPASYI